MSEPPILRKNLVHVFIKRWFPLTPLKEEDMLIYFYTQPPSFERLVASRIARKILFVSKNAKNRKRIFARIAQPKNTRRERCSMHVNSPRCLDKYRFSKVSFLPNHIRSDQTILRLMEIKQTQSIIEKLRLSNSLTKSKQIVDAHLKSLGFNSIENAVEYVKQSTSMQLPSIDNVLSAFVENIQTGEKEHDYVVKFTEYVNNTLIEEGTDGFVRIANEISVDLDIDPLELVDYVEDQDVEFSLLAVPNIDAAINELRNAQHGDAKTMKAALERAQKTQTEFVNAIESLFTAIDSKRILDNEVADEIKLVKQTNDESITEFLDELHKKFNKTLPQMLELIVLYLCDHDDTLLSIAYSTHQRIFAGFGYERAQTLWNEIQDIARMREKGMFRRILQKIMSAALQNAVDIN